MSISRAMQVYILRTLFKAETEGLMSISRAMQVILHSLKQRLRKGLSGFAECDYLGGTII